MAKIQIAILAAVLIAALPARADDDKPPPMTPKEFQGRLFNVIDMVAGGYYYEIDSGQLLRWAVKGLYDHRGNTFLRGMPEDIAERLEKPDPLRGDIRDLLMDVAENMNGDLHSCADIAIERMLRHLDGRTEVIGNKYVHITWAYYAVGIGARLGTVPTTGMIRVIYPFRDGPAYKAGLRSGDVITEITRPVWQPERPRPPKLEVIDAKGLKLSSAYDAISGEAGTKVIVKVRRDGTAELMTFEIARADAKDEETFYGVRRTADHRWDYWLDPVRKFAHVRLARFGAKTADDLSRVVAELHKQGLKGLVLDLRGNEGGFLHTGIGVAGLFVGESPIVTFRQRNPPDDVDDNFKGTAGTSYRDFPIVCLVDGETTRMGEILAACLQDNKRAILAGERTAGNAAVQGLHNVANSGVLKLRLTYGIFFRPNGKKLDRISPPGKPSDEWGVTPDPGYELKLTADERAQLRAHFESQLVIPPPGRAAKERPPAFKDRQLEMAVAHLQEQIRKRKKATGEGAKS